MSVLEYGTGLEEQTDHTREGSARTLGWAIHLGMSWTWCIGMFLPVLLIRDYGGWAWVVFAVPNVIGAAAMGWVLRPGQSEALVENHREAIRWFSLVTATFQIFFAFWMFDTSRMRASPWLMLGLAVIFFVLIRGGGHRGIVLAVVTLAVSLSCMMPQNVWRHLRLQAEDFPRHVSGDVVALAPVCLLGFLLSPYLDGTFHRARQALSSRASRRAFGLGFGVFFFLNIVFTLLYARPLMQWMKALAGGDLGNWIALHWTVQLAFTTALHWQTSRINWIAVTATSVVAGGIWYLTRNIDFRIEPGELVYRLFMGFYGLVFPAYVWICMQPTWREPQTPSQGQWTVLAIAVLAAAPFYWVGFIQGRMMWVLPGVFIVLAARFAVPRRVVRS